MRLAAADADRSVGLILCKRVRFLLLLRSP